MIGEENEFENNIGLKVWEQRYSYVTDILIEN